MIPCRRREARASWTVEQPQLKFGHQPRGGPSSRRIRIIGIVKEGVGRPRNDRTAGSALYRVPLRLSRSPSPEWSKLFVRCWNHPPSFTSMHRPGIARVSGDTIVLDGTTMDELERYHATTLRLCVDQANEQEAAHLQRVQQARERDEAERRGHEQQVDEIADRLKFDQ